VFVWSPGRLSERIAEGVWLVRGGFPVKIMNVYLIEASGGVTVFDAGIAAMTGAVAQAADRLGGVKRVVLAHADADHRGSAPGLGAPVYCHEADRSAAESRSPFRDYWDLGKLRVPANVVMPKLLTHWDGGAVAIAGTVQEGDDVEGFRVVHLPGHAPGLIGLFREADRLALCSDCIYTLDVETGLRGVPRTPHPAYNLDTDQARSSIRKLAELDPAVVWAGHTGPVRGDVRAQLVRAASAS
jgi:glyoxylase-like metal-dependent hydrolase (beta-lactamase superfamily II)